jgi:hypothetical protein
MRRFLIHGLLVALVLFHATTASAIHLFLGAVTHATNVGNDTYTVEWTQPFTVELRMDTEGETHVTSVFASVMTDVSVVRFISGTSPGTILFNFST